MATTTTMTIVPATHPAPSVFRRRPQRARAAPLIAAAALAALASATTTHAETFVVAEGDIDGLVLAIQTANGNGEADTIVLEAGASYVVSDPAVSGLALPIISSDLTILGNGATIARSTADGTPTFRLLRTDAPAALTLEALTLRGADTGGTGNGGALLQNGGSVTMIGCTMIDNAVGGSGGAIAVNSASGQLHAIGSTFIGNTAGTGGSIRSPGTVTLEDCLVQGNTASSGAGGGLNIYNGGEMTLTRVEVVGNTAQTWGGGISHTGATLTMHDCLVSDNTAATRTGGGIDVGIGSGLLELHGCVVSGNTSAEHGGGINFVGELHLHDSTVSGNTTVLDGGGLRSSNNGRVTAERCTISGNVAGRDGGGLHALSGLISLVNMTISGNEAGSKGGGIGVFSASETPRLVHLTVHDNVAGTLGDGIANQQAADFNLTHCIISGPGEHGHVTGPWVDGGFNIVQDGVGITEPSSQAGDAGLLPLTDNGGPTPTHGLPCGSIAIDAGDCGIEEVTEDQRGQPRPGGAACDIGAFEVRSPVADLNCDGVVDFTDLLGVLGAWGTCGDPKHCPEDLDGDGMVGLSDLLLVLSNFG